MSWRIAIPFCTKEDADRALQVMNFANYYWILEETDATLSLGLPPPSDARYAETIQAIVNEWPTEEQSRLYRLLYNAGIRINR